MRAEQEIEVICRAICKSGKFETGQGTCAPVCMEFLGSPRSSLHGCGHSVRVHEKLAEAIHSALARASMEDQT